MLRVCITECFISETSISEGLLAPAVDCWLAGRWDLWDKSYTLYIDYLEAGHSLSLLMVSNFSRPHLCNINAVPAPCENW